MPDTDSDHRTLSAFTSRNSILVTTVITYFDACRSSVNVAGVTVIDEISPVSSASTSFASGLTVYLPRPMNSEITRRRDPLLDFEDRRVVGEHRHADHSDRLRQKRAAAGERVAARRQRHAGRNQRRRIARIHVGLP